MNIDIAVGEVPWERELLSALALHPDLDIGRRLVDISRIDASAAPLIACPSVRGFTEDRLRQLMAERPVIIIADSIRPPWLTEHDIDFHDAATVDFQQIIAQCANIEPSPRLQLVQQPNRGRITAFVGVSGGVGVSTLAWIHARKLPNPLLIDANTAHPSLALLVDVGECQSYLEALQEYRRSGGIDLTRLTRRRGNGPVVLTLPIDRDIRGDLRNDERWRFLLAATTHFDDVILDAGDSGDDVELLRSVDRVVLVTTGTPLGLVRLCARAGLIRQHAQHVDVVVNRVRETAAGSRHAANAIRELVRSELELEPCLVDDDVVACDRGWLAGDWSPELRVEFMQQVIGSNDDRNSPIQRLMRTAGD